ncbi:unnamed protein product, partial [marine sediment metagenome]
IGGGTDKNKLNDKLVIFCCLEHIALSVQLEHLKLKQLDNV